MIIATKLFDSQVHVTRFMVGIFDTTWVTARIFGSSKGNMDTAGGGVSILKSRDDKTTDFERSGLTQSAIIAAQKIHVSPMTQVQVIHRLLPGLAHTDPYHAVFFNRIFGLRMVYTLSTLTKHSAAPSLSSTMCLGKYTRMFCLDMAREAKLFLPQFTNYCLRLSQRPYDMLPSLNLCCWKDSTNARWQETTGYLQKVAQRACSVRPRCTDYIGLRVHWSNMVHLADI